MRVPLLVIGAGLGGLALAAQATRAGVGVVVLEARPRIGGRILSLASADGVYDLGPAWVWPSLQPRLARLIREAGLRTYRQHDDGAFLAEDAEGRLQRRPWGFAQEPPSERLHGGTAALLEPLRAALPEAALQLGQRVVALQLDADGVTVSTRDSEGNIRHGQADQVALVLPPRLVAALEFRPALPADLQQLLAATPTWMAAHAKALVRYARPFWRETGLSGAAWSVRGPLGEIHDASLPASAEGALMGFFAWPAAQRARHPDLAAAVRDQLVHLFGDAAAQPLQIQIVDWAREELTAGPGDTDASAAHPSDCVLPAVGAWAGRLALAGSECSPHFAGYLEGALAATDHAWQRLRSHPRAAATSRC